MIGGASVKEYVIGTVDSLTGFPGYQQRKVKVGILSSEPDLGSYKVRVLYQVQALIRIRKTQLILDVIINGVFVILMSFLYMNGTIPLLLVCKRRKNSDIFLFDDMMNKLNLECLST